MPQPSPRLKIASIGALLFAGLCVVSPYTVRGIACGHDLSFHLNGWMEVAQQWREGVLFPRWAAFANYGSGEPRFIFYPPVSWILGGLLGSIVPWMFVPVVFDVCAVFLAGLSMHAVAREWFNEPEATLIAVAYAVNPYMLLTVYVRSAFAEMLAAALLPLLVLWIVRDAPVRRMFVPLALTIAAVWLTNVPAAIIATYVVVWLLVIVTIFRRNSRVFVYGAGAIVLGMLLASFYIVPVLYEKSWITLGQVLSAGVRPAENFLFARNGEAEHDAFMRALSWLALTEVAVTTLALFGSRRWRSGNPKLWWSLFISSAAAFLLMLPVSSLAYRLMPDLRFLQFPWRWLLVSGIGYAIFVVTAVPDFRGKTWLYVALFLGVIASCDLALQPHCDPADTSFMVSNVYRMGYGYLGTDEYVPAGGDNYEIKPDFPEFRFRSTDGAPPLAGTHVNHLQWRTYRKQFTIESPQPVEIELRLMNYPAWKVEVNGKRAMPHSADPTGRMVIALPAGHSEVEVRFVRTADHWMGDGISVAALIFLCGFWYRERQMHSAGLRS